jgi:hypothetical protein
MLPIMEVKRPFSDKDWLDTPEPVKAYIIHLEQLIGQMLKKQDELEKRIEKIEAQSKMNSQNSNKPPSSDSPFKRPKKAKRANENVGLRKATTAIDSRCWRQQTQKTFYPMYVPAVI